MKKVGITVVGLLTLCVAVFLVLKYSPSKITITSDMLEETLRPVSELSTSVFEYSGSVKRDETRQGLGIEIPGTTNSVKISYSGVIRCGYNAEAIKPALDEDQKTITVSLPEPEIFGNYIDTQNLEFETSNNILNPIDADDLYGYLKDIQEQELRRAVSAGIYEKARAQVELIITSLLNVFPEYTVQFADAEDVTAEAAEVTENVEPEPSEAPESTENQEPAETPDTSAVEQ